MEEHIRERLAQFRVVESWQRGLAVKDKLADHYEFIRVLGYGAGCVVVSLRHRVDGSFRACKFLHKRALALPIVSQWRDGLLREMGWLQSFIGCDEIVRLYARLEAEADESFPALLLEQVSPDGTTLHDLIGCLEMRGAVSLTYLLMLSLRRLHERDLLHRDLHPKNVAVCLEPDEPDGLALIDLSHVMSLTAAGCRGKLDAPLAYVPPEALVRCVDPLMAELFAVGVIMAELLVGRYLFRRPDSFLERVGPSTRQITAAAREEALRRQERLRRVHRYLARKGCPECLVAFVERATSTDPSRRFGDIEDMLKEIKPCLLELGALKEGTP